MRKLFGVFLGFSLTCLTACQMGGAKIRETPMGLSEIRRVISAEMGEVRKISPNGYEMDSKYHDDRWQILERPTEVKERFYTRVTILGDRRPYDLWVQVFVEVRTADGFDPVGQDDGMAVEWADRLKRALHESRDKRNIIDDFKAF